MTAIITIKRPNEILIISDGKTQDGSTEIALSRTISKVSILPKAIAVLACRGLQAIPVLVSCRANIEGWDFDEVLQNIEWLTRLISGDLNRGGQHPHDLGSQEITLAGFSKRENRLIAYFMPCGDRYALLGQPAFALREIMDIEAAPRPSPEAQKEAGFGNPPSAKKFDPEKHGLRLLEAMRLTPGFDVAIGGFAQLTTVSRLGVSTRILPGWPRSAS